MQKLIEQTIELPESIKAEISGNTIKILGGSHLNEKSFNAKELKIETTGRQIILKTADRKKNYAMLNSLVSHIQNMIEGIEKGYEYKLSIVYSHFPMNVAVKQGFVEINNFAGEKNPRKAKILGKTKVEVKGKDVIVTGNNKEDVSQTSANIENSTRVKGKDRRIFQDGIYITQKGIKA